MDESDQNDHAEDEILTSEDKDSDPRTKELKQIKDSLAESRPVGPLLALSKTVDQAKALLTFVDAISEKTLIN